MNFIFITLISLILNIVQTTTLGQIAYFQGPCPNGWSDYLQAQGKFILSAGSGYNINQTGGQYQHQITIEQSPTHQHHSGIAGWYNGYGGGQSQGFHQAPNGNFAFFYNALSSPVGGNKPHNNMPPYVVLRACKMISESSTGQLQNEIQNLKIRLEQVKSKSQSMTLGLGIAAIVCSVLVPIFVQCYKKNCGNESDKKYNITPNVQFHNTMNHFNKGS